MKSGGADQWLSTAVLLRGEKGGHERIRVTMAHRVLGFQEADELHVRTLSAEQDHRIFEKQDRNAAMGCNAV